MSEYEQGETPNGDVEGLRKAAMLLLEKCTQSLTSREEIPPTVLKDYGSTLKAIQSVLGARMDLEEQRARIDKLRKATEEERPEEVKVVFSDEVKEAVGKL